MPVQAPGAAEDRPRSSEGQLAQQTRPRSRGVSDNPGLGSTWDAWVLRTWRQTSGPGIGPGSVNLGVFIPHLRPGRWVARGPPGRAYLHTTPGVSAAGPRTNLLPQQVAPSLPLGRGTAWRAGGRRAWNGLEGPRALMSTPVGPVDPRLVGLHSWKRLSEVWLPDH